MHERNFRFYEWLWLDDQETVVTTLPDHQLLYRSLYSFPLQSTAAQILTSNVNKILNLFLEDKISSSVMPWNTAWYRGAYLLAWQSFFWLTFINTDVLTNSFLRGSKIFSCNTAKSDEDWWKIHVLYNTMHTMGEISR